MHVPHSIVNSYLLMSIGPERGATERVCCKKVNSFGMMVSYTKRKRDVRMERWNESYPH